MYKKYSHILNHFEKQDPKLFAVMREVDFEKWFAEATEHFKTDDYFLALCREIVGQQLSGKAANTIFERFKQLLANKQITPKEILKLPDQKLRDVGLSWAKVKYVKDLAQNVLDKHIDLENLKLMPEDQIIKELVKVKGIGNWTAEMFLIFVLKRENVFSHGDLGLKKGFEKIYRKKDPTKAQIEKVVEKWEPYKTYGTITLWHSIN